MKFSMIFLVFLLAACSSAPPTATPEPTSTPTPEPTSTPTPGPIVAVGGGFEFTEETLDIYYAVVVRGCVVAHRSIFSSTEMKKDVGPLDEDGMLEWCNDFSAHLRSRNAHEYEAPERVDVFRSAQIGSDAESVAFRLGHLTGCEYTLLSFAEDDFIDNDPVRMSSRCWMLLSDDVPLSVP